MNKSAHYVRNLVRKGDHMLPLILAKLALSLVQAEKVSGWLPGPLPQSACLSVYEPPEAS